MRIGTKFMSIVMLLLCGFAVALLPATAQDQVPRQVLTLHFNAAPAEPPTVEDTADGGIVFKVNPVGTVTGDLEGTFSQRITQVEPQTHEIDWVVPIATFFTIETEEGIIEGYYYGAFYWPEKTFPSDAILQQHGQILSVPVVYSDLYLADVFYDGIVDFNDEGIPLGDSGTIIIAPR